MAMNILRAEYPTGDDFMKDVVINEDLGRLLRHETERPLKPREAVILEVAFPALPNRVLLRGTVSGYEEGAEEGSDEGVVHLAVNSEDEGALDFLCEQASSRSPDRKKPTIRKHERVPMGIPVDWQVEGSGDVIISATDDVALGGVQIRTLSPPPVGTELTLKIALNPATRERVSVPGKVAWVKQDDEFQGMGVEFLPTESDKKGPLRELLNTILSANDSAKTAKDSE